MAVPSAGPEMLLFTVTEIVSPQFASIKGSTLRCKLSNLLDNGMLTPGYCPLTKSMFF